MAVLGLGHIAIGASNLASWRKFGSDVLGAAVFDGPLGELRLRIAIMWGRDDRVLPLDLGMILFKQIPRARLNVIPRCGHRAMWEQPEEFDRTTLSFLEVPA